MQEGKKASGSGEEEEEEESWLYGGGAGSSVISLGGRRAWETPGPSPTRCVRGGGDCVGPFMQLTETDIHSARP